MSLLTLEQANKIPALYTQEESADPIVYLKITCLNSYWLITEFDSEKELAFGYCELIPGGGELGYVSLEEIENLPYPINIEEVEVALSTLKKQLKD